MKFDTLSHIHALLKADEADRHAAFDAAKAQFSEYEVSYLAGDTVTDKLTYDHYEDEMNNALKEWGDAKRALLDFEDTDW